MISSQSYVIESVGLGGGAEINQRGVVLAVPMHEKLKDEAVFVGNLDPSEVIGRGTPELVEAKSRELCEIFADTPRFVLNAGCAIPADTPPENVRAMLRAARGI